MRRHFSLPTGSGISSQPTNQTYSLLSLHTPSSLLTMPILKPAPRSANIRIERVPVEKKVLKPAPSGVKKRKFVTKSSPSADKGKTSTKTADKIANKTSDETKADLKVKGDPKSKPKPKGKGKAKATDKASGDPATIPTSMKSSNRVTKRTKKSKELPKGLVAIGSFGSAAATHRSRLGAKTNIRLLPSALPLPIKKEGDGEGAKATAEPKKTEKKATIATTGLTTPSPTPSRCSSRSRKLE
ncbi:hypothetical protein BDP81DRAFT_405754 [Colletotrichum phormii]|uniref:Uncharacterized protein n=1 Tax=Colletotrichum phormii TaxID=359342 RepID=A0AAI9ZVR2_9PEZI|nr:uncharacterized protein BDP81DRAFT_405754 [Colletotrichum phormii]KAK1637739.1 hypothetical protein BDP81DRAFT_405754 [Colletotrichum phormii]